MIDKDKLYGWDDGKTYFWDEDKEKEYCVNDEEELFKQLVKICSEYFNKKREVEQ